MLHHTSESRQVARHHPPPCHYHLCPLCVLQGGKHKIMQYQNILNFPSVKSSSQLKIRPQIMAVGLVDINKDRPVGESRVDDLLVPVTDCVCQWRVLFSAVCVRVNPCFQHL